jgi:hypothetical protein
VPVALIQTGAHPTVHETIAATHLKENLRHEAPKDALREIGAPRAIGLGLGGEGVTPSPTQSAGVDEAQGGGQNASNQNRIAPNHARTPPAVHSGAADKRLRPHEGVPQRGEGRVRH